MEIHTHQSKSDNLENIYKPLDQQPNVRKFRLITLLPDAGSSPLQCSLSQANLVSYNDPFYFNYEALSYRWGDPEDRPRFVLVNGRAISITKNLCLALLHLRRTTKPRVLWVDALCINQDDIEERGQQVSLMPEIYKNASRVISWLGLENDAVMSRTLTFLLRLRSDSMRSDAILPQLISSGWSDEMIRDFLDKRYATSSDDESNIMSIIEHKRSKLANGIENSEGNSDDSDYVFDISDLSRQQYRHDATILNFIRRGWKDSAILDHMIDRYVEANTDGYGHGPHDHEIGTVRSFLQERIGEVKRRSQLSTERLVQEALLDYQVCLPTEKAVLSYPPEVSFRRYSRDEEKSMLGESAWSHLKEFCTLEYWNRLWIVQEIILARDLVLQSRDVMMQWRTFADIFLCLKYTTGEAFKGAAMIQLLHTPAAELVSLRREYTAQFLAPQENRGPGLLRIIVSCRHTSCHDPRDKIYGLLGLAENTGLDLYPDYTRTASGIYEEVMKKPKLWRSDQLCWFSSLLQQQLGGLPLDSPRSGVITNPFGPLFKTRAKVDGSISILGDSFTNIADAKALIANWQELYFHRILSHEPAGNLSVTVRNALDSMGHDFKRVFSIQSRCSHVHLITRERETPEYTWDPIQHRYSRYLIAKDCEECVLCSDVEKRSSEVPDTHKLRPDLYQNLPEELHSEDPKDQPLLQGRREGIQTLEAPPLSAHGESLVNLSDQLSTKDDGQATFPHKDPKHEHAPPRWIIGTRGQIGLVPATAKEGDKICHFQGSDVVATIRPISETSQYYSIIGSGLMLRRWGEEEVPIYEGSDEIFCYSVGQRGKLFGMQDDVADLVEFHLDINTLRLMTYKPRS